MSYKYDIVTIIYNPVSSGNAQQQAAKLMQDIRNSEIASKVVKAPTKYAGHAIELAKNAAQSSKWPLIISVSGDGGYNEVVNGVIASGNKKAVCAVEGAGNANDHWRTVYDSKSVIMRLRKRPRKIALLKLQLTGEIKKTRYAHSYIGIGLSAKVAHLFNKMDLNAWNEKKILLDAIMHNRSFKIRIEGHNRSFESLIAGNISKMAKQLRLDSSLELKNKTFNLIIHQHSSPWKIIAHLIGLIVKPAYRTSKVLRFRGQLLTPTWLQCDGETIHLLNGTKITITRVQDAIRTI